MIDDAAFAEQLNNLCHKCEARPRNFEHFLCQNCYNEQTEEQSPIHHTVPPENSSYEYLLDWCNQRNKDTYAEVKRMTLCDKFPIHKCRKKEKGDCSICMDTFKTRESIITLPCFHTFHEICCRQWIKEKSVCPICMIDVSQ